MLFFLSLRSNFEICVVLGSLSNSICDCRNCFCCSLHLRHSCFRTNFCCHRNCCLMNFCCSCCHRCSSILCCTKNCLPDFCRMMNCCRLRVVATSLQAFCMSVRMCCGLSILLRFCWWSKCCVTLILMKPVCLMLSNLFLLQREWRLSCLFRKKSSKWLLSCARLKNRFRKVSCLRLLSFCLRLYSVCCLCRYPCGF